MKMNKTWDEYDKCWVYECSTVPELIAQLQQLMEDNPDVDFSKCPISMNSEYDFGGVQLDTCRDGKFVDLLGG